MAITYTEGMDAFQSSGGGVGWEDYDIFTNNGILKGAIVEIIAGMNLVSNPFYMGVRTDGSIVDRRLELHEAEDGGFVTARFLATVDSSTGLIEIYNAQVLFPVGWYYIVDYWTDISWTETWIDLNVIKADESTWVPRNLFTSDSIPKGSVCLASLVNRANGNEYEVGVRIGGSGLARISDIHEAEGGGVNVASMFVKTSEADGIIEIWCEDEPPDCSVIIQGYFGANMDFQELFTQKDVTAPNIWETHDLSGDLDQDGRVVDFLLTHNWDNIQVEVGVRDADSIAIRFIEEHESEGGGYTGFGISAKTNSTGEIDLYIESTEVVDYFVLTGYFIFAVGNGYTGPPNVPGWNALEYTVEPPVGAGWKQLAYVDEPEVGAAWNRLKYIQP